MTYSPLASPSATREVLARHGLSARKSLGQHFLIDDNIVGRILDLASIGRSDVVVEVGPGIGTLTAALASVAGAVVAVEADGSLVPVARESCEGSPSPVLVIEADATSVDVEALSAPFGPPTLLVANLPYNVAATVVLRMFESVPTLKAATVMVQAEVADRMAATPGGKAYGAYTVKLRLLAEPEGRFRVPPACFMPQPRVDSAVLRLVRNPVDEAPDVLACARLVADAAFAQRRKTVANSLSSSIGTARHAIETVLLELGIDPRRRAETLDVSDFVELGQRLHAVGLVACEGTKPLV